VKFAEHLDFLLQFSTTHRAADTVLGMDAVLKAVFTASADHSVSGK